MLRHYYARLGLSDDDAKQKGAGDRDEDKDDGFLEYPLVVDLIIGNTRLSKVLMDGGSGLNILYVNTLELLEIDRSRLQGGIAPFHSIVLGKRTRPIRRIDLPVCFGTPSNYRKEVLTFELKMPGASGVITIESTYEHAYDYDIECIEYAEALAEAETLIAHLDQLSGEVPDSKRHAGAFEPVETIKLIPVDPPCPDDRALRISATLDIK
ncbi:uncharacterized protein [Miscanthus floridulus]|uniref:uncharacterized protein n=1 Tax=Miscanthus floridulus TaxID=154761 RepID=UPI00345A4666